MIWKASFTGKGPINNINHWDLSILIDENMIIDDGFTIFSMKKFDKCSSFAIRHTFSTTLGANCKE